MRDYMFLENDVSLNPFKNRTFLAQNLRNEAQ